MEKLPELNTLILPAFLTIKRSKRFKAAVYSNACSFSLPHIESKKLKKYKAFFDLREEFPLSYFYLLSQSAQVKQMLNKNFPLPIPGMIHLETHMTYLAEPMEEVALQIVSDVIIDNKEEGSLLPLFIESYFQNGIKIVEARSRYLVKRKSNRKKIKLEIEEESESDASNWLTFKWALKNNIGIKYARLSGDYNPIHIATPLAWLFGFKKKIIHGWYLLSRAVSEIEKETNMPAKSIEVNFLKAVNFPSKLDFEFRLSNRRNLEFRIKRKKDDEASVSGYIS